MSNESFQRSGNGKGKKFKIREFEEKSGKIDISPAMFKYHGRLEETVQATFDLNDAFPYLCS